MSKDQTQGRERVASPELAVQLRAQAELAALEKKLSSIAAAIEEQDAKINQARAAVPSLPAVQARLGDLLASEAAGHISSKERELREGELAREAAKVSAAAADASAKVARIQATISGLEAQQRQTKAAIAKAHGKCLEAVDAFLMAEAESLGREYLEFAKGLYDRFLKLMALDQLHRQATGIAGRHGKIQQLDSYELHLPAFRVGGHDDVTFGRTRSRLFVEGGGVYLERPINEAIESERARLASLGVALMWHESRFRELAEETDHELEHSSNA
jgi:hypothetical protein